MLLFASPTVWKSKNPYEFFLPLKKLEIRVSSAKTYHPKQIPPNPKELRKRLDLATGCGEVQTQHLEEKHLLSTAQSGGINMCVSTDLPLCLTAIYPYFSSTNL